MKSIEILFSLAFAAVSTLNPEAPLFQPPNWQTHEFNAPDEIPHERVRDIREGPDGAIWIATQGGGIARLQNGLTTVYDLDDGLCSNDTRKLAFDKWGGLWICTRGGINYLHSDGRMLSFTTETTTLFSGDFFYTVSIDHHDRVWFANLNGHVYYYQWQSQPTSSLEGEWSEVEHSITDAGWVEDSLIDNDGNIWFGFSYYQVLKINLETLETQAIDLNSKWKEPGSRPEGYDICLHPQGGILYLGTSKFHHIQGKSEVNTINFNTYEHQSTKAFSGIYFNDDLLIATRSGLERYVDQDFFETVLLNAKQSSPRIDCIYISSDNTIWLGTRSGLYCFSPSKWQSYFLIPYARTMDPLDYTPYWRIHSGLLLLNTTNAHIKLLYTDHKASDIYQLFEIVDGRISVLPLSELYKSSIKKRIYQLGDRLRYIGKDSMQEIFANISQGEPTTYNKIHYLNGVHWLLQDSAYWWNGSEFVEKQLVNHDNLPVSAICYSEETGYFFAGFFGWLENWNNGEGRQIELPDEYHINKSPIKSLIYHDDALWVATDTDGLYSLKDGEWNHHIFNEGLVGQGFSTLFSASDGALWVGSKTDGVNSYRDGRWVHYGEGEGISNGYVQQILEDENGVIWVDVFNICISLFHRESDPPSVSIDTASEILFPQEMGYFTVSGRDHLNVTNPGDLVYSWRVVDEQTDAQVSCWSPYSSHTTIQTSRLGPGDYRLEVVSQDKSRNTSPIPAVASFSVPPYFYTTPGFYIPALFSSFATIVALILLRKNYLKLVNSEFRYRNLLDKDDATLVLNWDRQGHLLYCNESCEALFATFFPDFKDARVLDWFSLGDQTLLDELKSAVERAFNTLESPQLLKMRTITDGVERWLLWRLRATVPRQAHEPEIHAVGVDITDQVNAEREQERERSQFFEFCEKAEIGLIRIGPSGEIASMNDTMMRMIEAERATEPLEHWAEGDEWAYLIDIVKRTKSTRSMSLKGKRLKSRTGFYAIATAIVRDDSIEMMVFDYSEQKYLQDRFAEISAYEQQKLGRELHDGLGQLLAALVFMGSRLQKKSGEGAESVTQQMIELNYFLNEALEQTRLVSKGLNPYTLQTSGLKEALNDVFNSYQQVYPTLIHFRYDEGLELESLQTAEGLFRIIRECVFNALKHARAECITVTYERSGGKSVFRIYDDGLGLPDDFGTSEMKGMGTRIVKYYADKIGAGIRWSSHKDTGTEVVIELE